MNTCLLLMPELTGIDHSHKMKLSSVLLFLPCISVVLAQEPQPPALTNFPKKFQLIESRADMTMTQLWVANGGTWLSGIAAMGTFVRQIVIDMSNKGSCTTTIEEYTYSKRSVETIATES